MYCVREELREKYLICGERHTALGSETSFDGLYVRIIRVEDLLRTLDLSVVDENIIDSIAIKIHMPSNLARTKFFRHSIKLVFPNQKKALFITNKEIILIPLKKPLEKFLSKNFATVINMKTFSYN